MRAVGAVGASSTVAVPALTRALDDPDVGLRRAAVFALGRIGPAAASGLPRLGQLLADPDSLVREESREAMRRIAGRGAP